MGGVTPGQWLDAFLAMPGRIATGFAEVTEAIVAIGAQVQSALADLGSAIDEVATELDALDAKLTEGATVDGDTAAAIAPLAQRLRDLRPDTPPVEPPAP